MQKNDKRQTMVAESSSRRERQEEGKIESQEKRCEVNDDSKATGKDRTEWGKAGKGSYRKNWRTTKLHRSCKEP